MLLRRKKEELFSIKKIKDNPFNSLNHLLFHKDRYLIEIKENRKEWEYEYHLIYNSYIYEQN